jgi:hypothetical protein
MFDPSKRVCLLFGMIVCGFLGVACIVMGSAAGLQGSDRVVLAVVVIVASGLVFGLPLIANISKQGHRGSNRAHSSTLMRLPLSQVCVAAANTAFPHHCDDYLADLDEILQETAQTRGKVHAVFLLWREVLTLMIASFSSSASSRISHR